MSGGTAGKLKLIGAILAIVLGGYLTGSLLNWARLPGVDLDRTPSIDALAADRLAPGSGPDTAKVSVVIFTDYQCTICRLDHPEVAAVLASEPRVRFVFKEWAILGPASRKAARVALGAGYQDRYIPMRNALMTARGRPDGRSIAESAARAGIDAQRLARDLVVHGSEIEAELARTSRQAFSLGLPGTPAYLIGRRLVIGRISADKLRRLIARALAE